MIPEVEKEKERIRDMFHDLSRTDNKTFLLLHIYDIRYKNTFLLAILNPSAFKVLNLIIGNTNNLFNAYF